MSDDELEAIAKAPDEKYTRSNLMTATEAGSEKLIDEEATPKKSVKMRKKRKTLTPEVLDAR
ncbi:hypothetical protein PR003_g14996 [Phytophthora rubi]|uniref:Uncharacterized protein n=1 Tax=Phytophthora rubi TaxID=129364 RepID=A0A6A3IV40_9STRA|nr:hypothetical protein PR002_g23260 [Phytophthora rubi]KAE8985622.1 hypothetical protein PR001_g22834 [Phytophthora rubi]KAE9331474.1 hypothetical protein PR003_g14996 [Phytophthora rubi]